MNAYEFPVWQMSVDEVKALIQTNRQQADRIAELEKQSEPVGRYYWESVADGIEMAIPSATTPHYMKDDFPLYLAPQTKPLSNEEILEMTIWNKNLYELYVEMEKEDMIAFARAIEAKVRGEK